jgi:hypothetical protein
MHELVRNLLAVDRDTDLARGVDLHEHLGLIGHRWLHVGLRRTFVDKLAMRIYDIRLGIFDHWEDKRGP